MAGHPPPNIQAIMDKSKGGQMPTMSEMQELQAWSMQQAMQALSTQAASNPHAAQALQSFQGQQQMLASAQKSAAARSAPPPMGFRYGMGLDPSSMPGGDSAGAHAASAPATYNPPRGAPGMDPAAMQAMIAARMGAMPGGAHAPGGVDLQSLMAAHMGCHAPAAMDPAALQATASRVAATGPAPGAVNPAALQAMMAAHTAGAGGASGGMNPAALQAMMAARMGGAGAASHAGPAGMDPAAIQAMIAARMGGGAGGHAAGHPSAASVGLDAHTMQALATAHLARAGAAPGAAGSTASGAAFDPSSVRAMLVNAAASGGKMDPEALKQQLLSQLPPGVAKAAASHQKPVFTLQDRQNLFNAALTAQGIDPAMMKVAPVVADANLHLQTEQRAIVLPGQYEAFLRHALERAEATLRSTTVTLTDGSPAPVAGAQLLATVQSMIAGKKPTTVGSVGCMLQLRGADTHSLAASVYAIATAALQDQRDPAQANSLCVALLNAGAPRHSYEVGRYALDHLLDAQRNGEATLQNNLGFAALALGDVDAAKMHFLSAVAHMGSVKFPQAHVGLAMIARPAFVNAVHSAGGGMAAALPELQNALCCGSCAAADVMRAEAKNEAKAGQSGSGNSSAQSVVESGNVVLGANLIRGGPPSSYLDYPIWEVPSDPQVFCGYATAWGMWTSSHMPDITAAQDERTRLGQVQADAIQKLLQRRQEEAAERGALFVPVMETRVLALLDDLENTVYERVVPLFNDFRAKFTKSISVTQLQETDLVQQMENELKSCTNEQQANAVKRRYIPKFVDLMKIAHSSQLSIYGPSFKAIQNEMREYWRQSCPLIDCLAIPELQDYRAACRRYIVTSFHVGHRAVLPAWPASLVTLCGLAQMEVAPEDLTEEQKKPADTPDPKKPSPDQEWPQPGQFGVGPLTVKYDKTGFTVEGGEGVFGGLGVKFSKYTQSHRRETTIWGGLGASASAGPMSFKADAVVSMTQADGRIVDVGIKGEASASLSGPGGIKLGSASAQTDLGTSLRGGPSMGFEAKGNALGLGSFDTKM